MRFSRITFVGGLAIGYVLGAQAGRERYEQLKRLARKAAESPAMQQTAGALQAQASATAAAARSRAAAGVRKGTARVARRRPAAARSGGREAASGNGSTAPPGGTEPGSFIPVNGNVGEHGLIE
jgi:hypothetical protein